MKHTTDDRYVKFHRILDRIYRGEFIEIEELRKAYDGLGDLLDEHKIGIEELNGIFEASRSTNMQNYLRDRSQKQDKETVRNFLRRHQEDYESHVGGLAEKVA